MTSSTGSVYFQYQPRTCSANLDTEREKDEELAYFFETELNIGRYSLYIMKREGRVTTVTSIKQSQRTPKFAGSARQFALQIRCGTFEIRICIDYPIDPKRIVIDDRNDGYVVVRMGLPPSKGRFGFVNFEVDRETKRGRYVSGTEMNAAMWRRFSVRCRKCESRIVAPRSVRSVRRLPTPRWSELEGSCAPPTATRAETISPPLGVWAEKGTCYVGRSKILFHRSMLMSTQTVGSVSVLYEHQRGDAAIETATSSINRDKSPLRCCSWDHSAVASQGSVFCGKCGCLVGVAFRRNVAADAIGPSNAVSSRAEDVALFKFRVAVSRESRSNISSTAHQRRHRDNRSIRAPNVLRRYGVGSIVGPLLLESVRRYRCFRVVLVSELTGRRFCRLRIVSWATELLATRSWIRTMLLRSSLEQHADRVANGSRNNSNDAKIANVEGVGDVSAAGMMTPIPIIRVAFHILPCTEGGMTGGRSSHAKELLLPSDVCTQFLSVLKRSSALLPKDRRMCGDDALGFVVW